MIIHKKLIQEKLRTRSKATLESLVPEQQGIRAIIWDRDKIEDNEDLKIFALSYEERINDGNEKDFLRPLIEYKPDGGY